MDSRRTNWLSAIYCTPGPANSNLINTEKAVPTSPENKAKIRYSVGVSQLKELPSEPYVLVSQHTARHVGTSINATNRDIYIGSLGFPLSLFGRDISADRLVECLDMKFNS